MRVCRAIAREIVRKGVTCAFTFMSEDVAPLVEELTELGVRVYQTRNEHVAIGMADGYSRVTGKVGVAIVGKGPGLTSGINALIVANKASSRVLVVSGETAGILHPSRAILVNKYIDQDGMLTALDIVHHNLRSAGPAAAEFGASYDLAASGTPTLFSIPGELFLAEAGDEPAGDVPLPRQPHEISDEDLETIAELLEAKFAAQHPVILAGRGAVRAGARDALIALAEATGALLATTVQAKGLFHGDPYYAGVVGTFSTPAASELLQQTDLVLAFGASLNRYTTYGGTIFGKECNVVHIDDDPAAHGKHWDVQLPVLADAGRAATALLRELERRGHVPVAGFRTDEVAARLARAHEEITFTDLTNDDGLDARVLMRALDRELPEERTIVVDAGNHMEFPIVHLRTQDETSLVWPIDYGAIGCSLGAALGAAVGRPDRTTVLCIGDGGMMLMLSDLDTAARYGLRLVVVISNDSALGAELHHLRHDGYPGDTARSTNPSFEAVGRALGLEAASVRSVEDIHLLGPRLREVDGPLLLDCRVNPEVAAGFYTFSQAANRALLTASGSS